MRLREEYRDDAQRLRSRMDELGLRGHELRQLVMDLAMEQIVTHWESGLPSQGDFRYVDPDALPWIANGSPISSLSQGDFRYVDPDALEVEQDGEEVTIRYFGRRWPDQPLEFLLEETASL